MGAGHAGSHSRRGPSDIPRREHACTPYVGSVQSDAAKVRGELVAGWAAALAAGLLAVNAWLTAQRESGTLAGPWSLLVAAFFTAMALVALGSVVTSHLLRGRATVASEVAAAVGIAFGAASLAIAGGWVALQAWG